MRILKLTGTTITIEFEHSEWDDISQRVRIVIVGQATQGWVLKIGGRRAESESKQSTALVATLRGDK